MFLLKFVGIIIIIIVVVVIYARNTLEVSDWMGKWATTRLPWQSLLVRCVLCFRVKSAEDPAVFFVRTARRVHYTSQYSFRANKTSGSMQLGILGWPLVQKWTDRKWGWKSTAQRMATPDPLLNTCGLSIRNSFLLYQQHILLMTDYACRVWDGLWGCCRL